MLLSGGIHDCSGITRFKLFVSTIGNNDNKWNKKGKTRVYTAVEEVRWNGRGRNGDAFFFKGGRWWWGVSMLLYPLPGECNRIK